MIITGKPAPLYYFTGRQTLLLGKATSPPPDELIGFLHEHNARYVVLGRLHSQEYQQLSALLQANCTSLALLAAFEPQTYVFHVLEPGTTADDTAACAALADYRGLPFRQEEG